MSSEPKVNFTRLGFYTHKGKATTVTIAEGEKLGIDYACNVYINGNIVKGIYAGNPQENLTKDTAVEFFQFVVDNRHKLGSMPLKMIYDTWIEEQLK